jgi:CRISPR-associated protein Cas1
MSVLYVVEQGAKIRKTGHRIVVEKDDKELLEVEAMRLDTILVFGNVQVSTQALAELLGQGIEFALFSSHGELRGQLTPPHARNVELRLKQYGRHGDPAWRLQRAREVVEAKLRNSLMVLKQADWDRGEPAHAAARAQLEASLRSVAQAADLDQLRGVEGAAARAYFSCFPVLLKASVPWSGRNRRPPRDPVNAFLSLGYTLLADRIRCWLDGAGLDPYLGNLHDMRYGRPSLALDHLEPLRVAVVDKFALRCFNLRMFTTADFSEDPDAGVRFTPEALKRFFARWEEALRERDLNRILDAQVASYRQAVQGDAEAVAYHLFED